VSNFAPVFENGPPETELVEFETSGSYIYQIPSSLDIEGDAITMILSGLEEWMIYDELNQTIALEELNDSKVGTHSITIDLIDAKGESKSYEVDFEIINTHAEVNLQEFLGAFDFDVDDTT